VTDSAKPLVVKDGITEELIEHCARMAYFDDDQTLPSYARIPWPDMDGATKYRYWRAAKAILNAAAEFDAIARDR